MARPRAFRRPRLLLLLFAAALLLRLAYLWDATDNPFLDALGLDARYYDLRAQEILREGVIGNDAYFMGPLYPHLLALVYAVAGRSLLLVRILQACVGAFVPVLLYRIGRRLFNPTIALVASIIGLLYAPFLFYTATILDTALNLVLLLWILDRLTAPSASLLHRFLSGVLFGLAAAGRANIILFLPFALYALARASRRGGWDARAPLALLTGFLVVVGITTAHNLAASGDFVPLTSNGGLNLYIGNGPESSGAYVKPKGLDVDEDPSGRRLLERELARPLSPAATSDEWRRRAVIWMREHPGSEAKLLLRKAVFFFSDFEIPQIETYRFQMRYSPIVRLLHFPFGVIAPLGLAGTILHRGRRTSLLVWFLGAYAASIVLFFVLTRYRLPVVPVLILFAAAFLARLSEAFRARDWGGAARRAAWTVPFFVFCNVNFYGLSANTGEAQSYYRLGIIAQGRGETDEAVGSYRRSIELDPNYARSRLNLGELLAVAGRGPEAETQFREAIRLDPEYPKAQLNLGTLLYRSGRIDEGRGYVREALRLDPDYGKAWLHLSAIAILKGEDGAMRSAEAALSHLPPADPARAFAGDLAARAEELEAIERWRDAHGFPHPLPAETRQAIVAEVFGDRGDVGDLYRAGGSSGDPSALYALGAFLYRRNDPAGAEPALTSAERAAPDHPFVSFVLGVIASREGRRDDSFAHFLHETEVNPAFTPSWKFAAIAADRKGLASEAERLASGYRAHGGVEDEAIRSILAGR